MSNPDRFNIAPIGGSVYMEITAGETTVRGCTVQFDGADVTADAATVNLLYGGITVGVTAVIASGSVTWSITPTNLTNLGASEPASIVQAQVEADYASGGVTYTARQVFALTVSRGEYHFPLDSRRIARKYPEFDSLCSAPDGSSWFPQDQAALEDCRDWINVQRGEVATYILTRPAILRPLVEAFVIENRYRISVYGGGENVNRDLDRRHVKAYDDLEKRKEDTLVLVNSGTNWGDQVDGTTQTAQPPHNGWTQHMLSSGGAL